MNHPLKVAVGFEYLVLFWKQTIIGLQYHEQMLIMQHVAGLMQYQLELIFPQPRFPLCWQLTLPCISKN